MLPTSLTAAHFAKYPPDARQLAVEHLPLLKRMPLALLGSLLQELIEYDYKFPAERLELNAQVDSLSRLSPEKRRSLFAGFQVLRVAPSEEKLDWVNQPQRFTEQFSADLWQTHQMDAFRDAATAYGHSLLTASHIASQPVQRLGIAVIGQGVGDYHAPLFEKLCPLGTYFSNVNPDGGLRQLLEAASARAEAHPAPYAHWYVDGGVAEASSAQLTGVSYAALQPVRTALLGKIQEQVRLPGMGPERLRDYLAQLTPEAIGLRGDPVLDRFTMKLLTEGSGTQIFSTTFAQWTTREVLRRSQPRTVLVRFAARQRQRSMSEMLSAETQNEQVDLVGSLIDAEMATYYHWINQQRLPGYEQSAFVAWFEGHRQAFVIGPSLPRGAESSSSRGLADLVSLATG